MYSLSLHDALPILLEDKLCLIFKLAPSVCRMTFPILASLLVRLVVLLPFQLLRLSLATPSRWTPLALSVFLHCVVALLLTLDRKSGSAGMPRPTSYAVFCLKKKKQKHLRHALPEADLEHPACSCTEPPDVDYAHDATLLRQYPLNLSVVRTV